MDLCPHKCLSEQTVKFLAELGSRESVADELTLHGRHRPKSNSAVMG